MSKRETAAPDDWAADWLAAVADGSLTMSQRKLSSVVEHGGTETVCEVARRLGVHLAVVTDDRGEELVLASVHPIRVLC